jgi:hypothetical protein
MKRKSLLSEFKRVEQLQTEQVRTETFAMLGNDMHSALHDELYMQISSANDKHTLLEVQCTIRAIARMELEIELLTENQF